MFPSIVAPGNNTASEMRSGITPHELLKVENVTLLAPTARSNPIIEGIWTSFVIFLLKVVVVPLKGGDLIGGGKFLPYLFFFLKVRRVGFSSGHSEL